MKVEAMCKIPHQKPTEGFCFSHSSPYKYVPLSILLWCLALLFRKFWVWISAQRLGTQTEAQLCKNLKIFCISYLLLHSFLCNIFFVGYPPEVRGWFVWNNLSLFLIHFIKYIKILMILTFLPTEIFIQIKLFLILMVISGKL
jgi:hypothetical protein